MDQQMAPLTSRPGKISQQQLAAGAQSIESVPDLIAKGTSVLAPGSAESRGAEEPRPSS